MPLKTLDPHELVSWVNETLRRDVRGRCRARSASHSPNGTSPLGSHICPRSLLTHKSDAPTGQARWRQEVVDAGRVRIVSGQRLARSSRLALRGGFTLVEMLVVITVFVFLLASVALAIGTLFRAQGELQDELAQANIASRLAAHLRADAHLASSAEVVQEGDTTNVRLSLPNAEINYATHPRRIIRTVTQGESEAHRDVFSLLEGTTTHWEISAQTPAFITLTTSYRSPELREGVARAREHRVEASIGLHAGGAR